MANAKTAILGLGGIVLTLIGVGLFFALGGDFGGEQATSGGDTPEQVADKEAPEGPNATKKKRDQKKGSASIFGLLKFQKGETAAVGQEVQLSTEGEEPWKVKTDEKGAFRFESIPRGGPYEVRVAADNYATIRLPGIGLDRDEARDMGTLWLDAAVSLDVYVKTYQDKPLPGAKVFAYANASGNYDWNQQRAQLGIEPVALEELTTDATGKVVFPELAPGSWTFTAVKEGYARDGRAAPALSSKREPKPLTIYLGTAFKLVGRVLDGKENAIGDALVMAAPNANMWGHSAAPLYTRVKADEQGKYTFEALPGGDTQIWAARPGGIPSKVATLRVPPVDEFDLRLIAGGILKGKVTLKDTETPVADAKVRATGWSSGGQRFAEATTDEQGNYVIDTLLEGMINALAVEKDGYIQFTELNQQWQQIPINRDDTIERNLSMEKAAQLSGTITGPNGPEAEVMVNIFTMRANNSGWDSKNTKTDSKGHYEFPGVMPGETLIQLTKAGLYQKGFPQNMWGALQSKTSPERYTVKVPAEGSATKDVTLEVGTLVSGIVRMLDGASPEGVKVNAGGASADAKADGTFVIQGVTPNPAVQLNAFKEGYAAVAKQIEVKDDKPTTELEIELNKTGIVTGTITSNHTGELVDAYVQIQTVQGNQNNPWMIQQMAQMWGSTSKVPVKEDGSYEIPMPYAEGKFQIRAVALGHEQKLSKAVDVVPGQERYQVDVGLEEGITLRGRVLIKNTTQGVSGATVQLAKSSSGGNRFGGFYPGMGGNGQTIVAVTNPDGSFEVPNQSLGNYTVTANAEGHVTGTKSMKLPEGNDVDVFIEPALVITGFVRLGDGTPIEGVMVSAQSADKVKNSGSPGGRMVMDGMLMETEAMVGGSGGTTSTTGSDGGFRIQKLKSGNFHLNVTPTWNGKANIRNFKSDPVAAGTEGKVLTVQAGMVISGKVVDPDDKPMPGLYVSVNPNPTKTGMQARNAMTKQDGTFEAVGLIEGTYKLTVQAGWGAAADFTGAERDGVTAGEKDITLKLERGLTITGTVLDSEGKPAADKTLFAQWQPDPNNKQARPPSNGGWRQSATDAKGKFEIKGLAPGTYRVNVGNPWGGNNNSNAEVLAGGNAVAAGTQNLQLNLMLALTIKGSVVDESGQGMKNVSVRAQPKAGGNALGARTDAQGEFEIKSIPPGTAYTLTAQRNGSAPATENDVMGGTSGVRLVLSRGLEVSGKLYDSSGNPMARGYIQAISADGKSRGNGNSDNDGNFTISGLLEGRYNIKVYVRTTNDDGSSKGSWVEAGTLEVPSSNVELRLPAQ